MGIKIWQRIKGGFLAMVCGMSMVMAVPVCAEAQTSSVEGVNTLVLSETCPCGAELIIQGSIEVSCTLSDDRHHVLAVDQYYRCKYGHVQCIRVTTTEEHSRNQYDDLGHRTNPDELFGEHTYLLKCRCGKEYETVSIICYYPGTNSHNTPF